MLIQGCDGIQATTQSPKGPCDSPIYKGDNYCDDGMNYCEIIFIFKVTDTLFLCQ